MDTKYNVKVELFWDHDPNLLQATVNEFLASKYSFMIQDIQSTTVHTVRGPLFTITVVYREWEKKGETE